MKKILFAFAILLASLHNLGCHSGNKTSTSQQNINTTLAPEDTALFRLVQHQTFKYFMDGAEPVSGLARERFHEDNNYPQNDKNVVTSGGAGFGVMAILVGIERGFVTKEEGRKQLEKIVRFLETADRFHGAWPHWWNGETGKVKPFSRKDDGGDLVESSFMIQGLLCVRQYFQNGNAAEKSLAQRADKLWKEVDFNWYRNGKNVLYWHWSPNFGWDMNFPVRGYNECLIMYVLAASSPTHPVPPEVYHEGWADKGNIKGGNEKFGYRLQLKHQGDAPNGGPLFWAHYSYLALDPRGLKDQYADYWEENRNQTLINYQWCVINPKKFKGYAQNNWGLTSSYSMSGGVTVSYAKGANISNDTDYAKKINVFGTRIDIDKRSVAEMIKEAVDLTAGSDIIVAVVGEASEMSGESSSRSTLNIPAAQRNLLVELKKTGKPLVLVIMAGRPLTLNWETENADAILYVWHGGQEVGNAVADVLFGNYNPSGKLTTSFPRNVGQVPVYYNHLNTGRPNPGDPFQKFRSNYLDVENSPMYPFGFGLSYTSFSYSDIKLSSNTMRTTGMITATVTVTNRGNFDGEEVVQLYIRDLVASISRPMKELKGFQKVMIRKGESRTINFSIKTDDLKFYNSELKYVAEPGDFKIFIGGNSRDVKEADFKLL